MAPAPTSDITLYFLQASRSIRIAWLLEELSLPYKSIFFPRVNKVAPQDFRAKSSNSLGKAPTLHDGPLIINESGAITEYLIEKYDPTQQFLGVDPSKSEQENEKVKNRVRTFIHAAEGTFMVHALAITYARWNAPKGFEESGGLKEMEKGMAVNVGKDLDWLEKELEGKRLLAGEKVTAADTMCLFSVQFIFARDLVGGTKVDGWGNVKRWIDECEGTEGWKRAVEKTGHEM